MHEMRGRPRDAAAAAPTAEQLALVRKLTPIARGIARAFSRNLPTSVQSGDVVSAAMLGVWETVVRHSGHEYEVLKRLARHRIRGAIIDELRRQDWLPRRMRAKKNRSESTPVVVYAEDIFAKLKTVGYKAATSPGVRSASFADSLLMSTFPKDEESSGEENERQISAALLSLTDREAWVVALLYAGDMKARDIADALGVSEPRVSQLRSRALEKMRLALARQDELAAKLS